MAFLGFGYGPRNCIGTDIDIFKFKKIISIYKTYFLRHEICTYGNQNGFS